MAWYPRRLGLLRLHLVAEGQRRNNLIMALIIRERQRLQEERRVWHYWVRPWIERRRLFGQYHTLFQELERESHGDYQAYIRMDPNTLAAMTYECTVYLDVFHFICLVFDLHHSGEAVYISLIDFLWTSTGTKSYQWVNGSTFDCDCLHQLWWCFCHVGTGAYWCCSVLGLSNLCYSVSWNL